MVVFDAMLVGAGMLITAAIYNIADRIRERRAIRDAEKTLYSAQRLMGVSVARRAD